MKGKVAYFFFFLIIHLNIDSFSQNRVIINSSFEPPYTPHLPQGTMKFVQAANGNNPEIKGWSTTASDYQIEVWHDGMEGVNVHPGLGKQWAEINGNMISRLYENVCLIKGEVLNWKFYHRGRSAMPDEMELNIYSDRGIKVATLQKASTNNSNWKEYAGYYKVDFPSGNYQLSFEAIRTGSGNSTIGNFVDGITIELAPLLQFASETFSGFEATTKNVPRLILNGTVPHGGSVVTINVEESNAIFREDYLFPGTFTIPAGIYTPSNYLIIPLSIMNDNIPEGNEWIKLKLISASAGVKLMDADCDGTGYLSTTYTIMDDDTANRISKPTAVFNNKKISTSDTVTLNILFEQGTDITTKSSEGELLELLRFMEKNPKAEIELEGHTEKDESTYTKRQKELNLILSERRVKKIKNYMIGKGISGGRIRTMAYGGTRPISEDPAKNRRVVMRVLKL